MLNACTVLLHEGAVERGHDYWSALDIVRDPTRKQEEQPAPDTASSLAVLGSVMAGTNFKGPK